VQISEVVVPPKTKSSVEISIAKALKHPLRVEILAILDNRVASPAELAEELNERVGNVAYHVKQLKKFKCVELVRTRQVRGATEHFYRAIRRPYFHDSDWQTLPLPARQGISGSVVQMVFDDVTESFEAGAFDAREDRHLSRTPLRLDERGWREMNSMLNQTVERALDLQAEAAERMSTSEDSGVSVRMALFGFEAGIEQMSSSGKPESA
jgi:DNA-binding transcriptional ArsR family regulator